MHCDVKQHFLTNGFDHLKGRRLKMNLETAEKNYHKAILEFQKDMQNIKLQMIVLDRLEDVKIARAIEEKVA